MAVKRQNLFSGGNLLLQAPTSSGKTFMGEMAAIQTALRRKKVIYVVPLKALAEEKFVDFREKYAPYGIEVIISTRDRREFDGQLEAGNFSIAVVVYEKLAQLLVRRPERLEEVELVIVDELGKFRGNSGTGNSGTTNYGVFCTPAVLAKSMDSDGITGWAGWDAWFSGFLLGHTVPRAPLESIENHGRDARSPFCVSFFERVSKGAASEINGAWTL